MAEIVTQDAFCDLPFTRVILNAHGTLSTCCHQKTQLGSILNNEIMDLWNCDVAKEIRYETRRGRLHHNCSEWRNCPYMCGKFKFTYDFEAYENHEYPTYLEICLPNTHCNIGGENPNEENPACIMCTRNFDFKPDPQLTDVLVRKAKPIMPYLRYLSVLGVAEPFWKDITFKIFDGLEFDKYNDQITFMTNHNGICFTERVQEIFLERVKKSNLQFSLDACTPETYIKIRRVNCYEMILQHLKNWVATKTDDHKVIIWNNINLVNVHEMSGMVETAAEYGVDELVMIPTHDQMGRADMGDLTINIDNQDIFKKAAADAQERAHELGVNMDLCYTPFLPPPPKEMLPVNDLVQITM